MSVRARTNHLCQSPCVANAERIARTVLVAFVPRARNGQVADAFPVPEALEAALPTRTFNHGC